jgi:hypothetical protein
MTMLVEVQRYLKRTGMPATKFGRLAINDPRLVGDLRNGRDLRPETEAKIARFITANPSPPPSARPGRRR